MNMKSKWEISSSHLSKVCNCKVKFIRNKRKYQSHLDFGPTLLMFHHFYVSKE
jgi:hypothetical protein